MRITSYLALIWFFCLCLGCQDNKKTKTSFPVASNETAATIVSPDADIEAYTNYDNIQAISTEIIENVSMDIEKIEGSTIKATNIQYLIDIEPAEVNNILGGIKPRTTYSKQPIIIDGITYSNGFTTHPPSEGLGEVIYNINGMFSSFETKVAVFGNGTVKFSVIGDTNTLYISPVITQPRGAYPVSVDVTGVNQLKLVVDNVEYNWSDHAVWCDPKLIP